MTDNSIHPGSSSPRFGGVWAKAEIFLGLTAAGAGLFLGVWQVSRPAGEIDWIITAAALALWVLGGYLALAGQRSHLYRSNIELAASLREESRHLQDQVSQSRQSDRGHEQVGAP